MGSLTSEDGSEDGYGGYSPSANVSESESSAEDEVHGTGGASSSSGFSSFAAGGSVPLTPTFNFPVIGGKDVLIWDENPTKPCAEMSELETMKERFAKLLLGEDMSGGGKGVSTALAISNAITNLSATVFGELWRLEPLVPPKKALWLREMEWLLSVSDSIVDLVPSLQQFPGGGTYEVMETRPRSDLCMNLPALKKLDSMLMSILDGFLDTEFWYVDRGIAVEDDNKFTSSLLSEEKWWLPLPKVPGKGLSEESRKTLQQLRDCTNQILKAAVAINGNVLAEMEIPMAYIETLPKNGRECLGDVIYRSLTADQFSPDHLLDCLDLSSEHRTLDVANRIEAAAHVWKLKKRKNHPNLQKSCKTLSSWGGKVKGLVSDGEKNRFLAQRAETLLRSLKLRFPCLPQTALDTSKIQYNKDVGHAILESYSRVMESLAFNIIARIDDVVCVDDATKRCGAAEESMSILFNRGGGFNGLPLQKKMSPSPFSTQHTPYASPFATPTMVSSPPQPSSPKRSVTPLNKSARKLDQVVPSDFW